MIRVRQVKVKIVHDSTDIVTSVATKLKINPNDIGEFKINKRSLDARKKNDLKYIYEVDISVKDEDVLLKKFNQDVLKTPIEKYEFKITGTKQMKTRPVIVGSGPAGLFCAYLLSKHGYKPIIIERGEKVEDRIKTVDNFWETGILNRESNVQFGEGGAGTFSDGKLNTLTKDKNYRNKLVLDTFVYFKAPEEITYLNKPHIGTDLLRNVVINMRQDIIKNGGEFRYNTCLTNLIVVNNQINKIEVNHNEIIDCDNLILAIGHSARDTFQMLYDNNLKMEAKPFAVGVRIEHLQKLINRNQYGTDDLNLPPADYKLTYTTKNKRGVYSFCMCPGGYVVNSSSELKHLTINGMSNYLRDSNNSNSAIVVTINPKDYGINPLDGIKYQRELESKAYQIDQGNIPVQLLKDFMENKISVKFGEIEPVFKGKYSFVNLNDILPSYVRDSIKEAIPIFNNKISGFSRDDAIIAGIETRTSSPVRIVRDELLMSNIKGIYPCGEGSGYAGGITTSAMDGIKVAEVIASIYKKD